MFTKKRLLPLLKDWSSFPLYSADDQDRAIYLDKLEQNLTPGYQTSFVVGNPNLIRYKPTCLNGHTTHQSVNAAKNGNNDQRKRRAPQKNKKIYINKGDFTLLSYFIKNLVLNLTLNFHKAGLLFKKSEDKIKQKCNENNLHLPTNNQKNKLP